MLGSFAPIVDGLDRAPADCNAATFFFKKLHQNSGLQIGMVHGCARFLFWPLLSFCALGHFFFCFGTLSFLGHFHFWDTFIFGTLSLLGYFAFRFWDTFLGLFRKAIPRPICLYFRFQITLGFGLIFFLSIGG